MLGELVGAFLSGEGCFFVAIFLFGQGEGHFFHKVIYFSFSPGGGGSPLFGENNTFMAEPSDRPAIKDRLGGRKKRGGVNMKRTKKNGKKKKLNFPTRSEFFSPAGRSRHDDMRLKMVSILSM